MTPTSMGIAACCVALCAFAVGCANLPDIQASVCGNAVVEESEDCDSYAPAGQACYAASTGTDKTKACRWDCSRPELSCPSGSACGTDGVCHFGTDAYLAWGSPVSTAATKLLLGDFDGDRIEDLLALGNPSPGWQRLPKLFFFDGTGNVVEQYDPKMPIGSPSVVDLNPADQKTNRRRQLLFSTDQGVATLSANSTRLVLPDAYPDQRLEPGWSYRVLTISGSAVTALGDGILVIYSNSEQTRVIGAETGTEIAVLDRPFTSFVGEPLAANINAKSTSPCSEYLFAYQGESTAYAIEPCNSLGIWAPPEVGPKPLVSLPTGHSIAQPLRAGHINDDTFVDLILGDDSGKTYLAFGLGDGRFAADLARVDETLGQVAEIATDQTSCINQRAMSGFPLAVGDLNRDGRDDLVLPDGVFLSNGVARNAVTTGANSTSMLNGCPGNAPFVGTWTLAYVGDLTGDGILDLVAGAAGDPDMDFFLGTGLDRMNRFGITTEGSVSRFVGGDFDGDLIGDVAFSTHVVGTAAASAQNSESVSIAFGSRDGAPNYVSTLGSFRNIRQLSSANYVDSDAISELGVVSQQSADAGEQLAIFVGNPGRHPIAALGLSMMTADGPTYSAIPVSVAAGRFDLNSPNSVVAVGRSCNHDCTKPTAFRFWRSTVTPDGSLDRPNVSLPLPPELFAQLTSQPELSVEVLSGDLDYHLSSQGAVPDNQAKQDELLLLTSGMLEGQAVVSLWLMSKDPSVFSQDPDGAESGAVPALGKPSMIPGSLLPNSDPALVDLDGDGFLDLALILRQDGENRIAIAWNDGSGGFALEKVSFVTLGTQPPVGLFSRNDGSPGRLLAISDDGLFEIHGKTPQTMERNLVSTILADIPGGNAVAFADLTGDGLLDIVVSGNGMIQVFAAKERDHNPTSGGS